MSEVTLHINGRDYRVRAGDGEEEKLVAAGHVVDAKCEEAKAALGTLSDASLFFYVALMLADEAQEGGSSAPGLGPLADRLESLASKLEKIGA